MMAKIAGHNFDGGLLGNRCTNLKYREGRTDVPCNVNLTDILGVEESDIGKPDIACIGVLNRAEYEELKAERERIWALLKS